MEPLTVILPLLLIIIGFALSAFLTGNEVAIFALAGREEELDEGQKKDARLINLLREPEKLRIFFLLTISFVNVATAVLTVYLINELSTLTELNRSLLFAINIFLVAFLLLVLSTITPKITAVNNPLRLARKNSGTIRVLYFITLPFTVIFHGIQEGIEKWIPRSSQKMTSEDIIHITEPDEDEEGNMEEDEREIIENVFEFGQTTVREIMTSRVNIVAVSVEDSLPELLQLIREKNLSRMPLYENDLDNILGIIYAKDLLAYLDSENKEPPLNWKTIARKAFFIPDSKKLDDLLRDFQQEKTHIAIVVDEYGGTEGIVTMDDILEEIVGDFSDDDEDDSTKYTRFKSGIYIFDAKINLDDLEEILKCEITSEDDDFETLGGLIYHLIESLPTVGERITYKNLEFTVHSVTNNRISKVRVKADDKKELPASD